MTTFDFSPLYRSMIGFDQLLPWMENAGRQAPDSGYPPFNVEKVDDDRYQITVAVAGFNADDLNVEQRQNLLLVSGDGHHHEQNRNYLYRGIAGRAFNLSFQLSDYVKVQQARLDNGLLRIDLVREVPEEMKPRRIEIGSGAGKGSAEPRRIEGHATETVKAA